MLEEEYLKRMQESVEEIRRRMAEAAVAAGRRPEDVRLCAACKARTIEEVKASAGLAIDLFGENRVQELLEKSGAGAYLEKPCHFIGQLQTNKVNKVVGRVELIQSVDSEKLLLKIDNAAARLSLVQDILLEVNIGAEESKAGISEADMWGLLELAAAQPHVRLRGLMSIPPADANEAQTRTYFARMRELLEKAAEKKYENTQMDILSAGMSDSYEAAIKEGSTMVRIGTAIYGPRSSHGTK